MPSEIEVSCPGCNAIFSVPIELSGEVAECSECAAVFEIPKLEERPDAIDTDTGVVKGVAAPAPTSDYTSTATNTVKLSRSSIGMIPTLKDSFTFGQKDPGASFGAPPPQAAQPQAPQSSAWGAQPGMQQPRMAPPPPPARPAPPQMAPQPQQQPRMAPAPVPVQQQMPPPPPARPVPQQMAPQPQQQPQQQPRVAPAPAPVQQQMPQPTAPQGGVASMLGGAPAQAPVQQQTAKPTFTKPPQPQQPPQARPTQQAAPATPPAPAHSTGAAPVSSTQGLPAQQVSIKLPDWTKLQLKQGEEAVAYKELEKNPAISAVLISIPVILSAIAVLVGNSLGLIIVGVLAVVTFIVAFVMSKDGAKRAIILTTQRAVCIFGKDRIELKK